MLKTHGRFPCIPFKGRPDFRWPGDRRLAVYLAVNVEHFPYGEPVGIDLDRPTLPWSQRSWLWREYGNRVGGWKLIDLFDELALPVGVIVNTANYAHNPELLEAHRRRGDEIIGHGRSNGERQIEMSEDAEREMIREVTATLERHDGRRPGRLTIEVKTIMDFYTSVRPLSIESASPRIVIQISDTGTGMNLDTQAHMFEPLFSTKETNIGLGLTAVFGIVQRNGGTLEVDSRPGQGTVVRVLLPAVPAAEKREETVPKAMLAKGDETILLVAENEIDRKLALSTL